LRQPGDAGHAEDEHAHAERSSGTWRPAIRATLHCLIGCAIGEIVGMAIGTALGWQNLPTVVVAIALAFVFGYSFTFLTVRRAGLRLGPAVRVAGATDTMSIAIMELVDNAVIALTPGALNAHLTDWLFWASLLGGFAIAFVITTPANRWLIRRGRGHAVMHRHLPGGR
jgi:hypothetical protein